MPKYPFKTRIARVPQEPFRGFNHKRQKRLGTAANPAIINVHTDARRDELLTICQENDWHCQISVNPDEQVNEQALEVLKNYPKTTRFAPKPDRNEPCSCGSGKKYKKCCYNLHDL